jgi:hypothetical protein
MVRSYRPRPAETVSARSPPHSRSKYAQSSGVRGFTPMTMPPSFRPLSYSLTPSSGMPAPTSAPIAPPATAPARLQVPHQRRIRVARAFAPRPQGAGFVPAPAPRPHAPASPWPLRGLRAATRPWPAPPPTHRPGPRPRVPPRPRAGAGARPDAARSAGSVVELLLLPPSTGYTTSEPHSIWYIYLVTLPNCANESTPSPHHRVRTTPPERSIRFRCLITSHHVLSQTCLDSFLLAGSPSSGSVPPL